jgi:hypothetical protein
LVQATSRPQIDHIEFIGSEQEIADRRNPVIAPINQREISGWFDRSATDNPYKCARLPRKRTSTMPLPSSTHNQSSRVAKPSQANEFIT